VTQHERKERLLFTVELGGDFEAGESGALFARHGRTRSSDVGELKVI